MNPNQLKFQQIQKDQLFELKNGTTLFCDRPDKLHFREAMAGFEKVFSPYLNRSMWAIDIGAACGDSTISMAGQLAEFPDCRVIAFGPSKEIYQTLVNNMGQNPICRYDIHTVAAGEENSFTDFIYSTDNGGLVLPDLIPERGPCEPTYKVHVVNTYQYLRSNYSIEELDKIGFIKIDAEGYDY